VRWYDYVFVVTCVLFGFSLSYHLNKKEVVRFKVVDVVSIIDEEKSRLMNKEGDIQEKMKDFESFLKRLDNALKNERGVVIIKQAVVGGDAYEDITEKIRRKVTGREENL